MRRGRCAPASPHRTQGFISPLFGASQARTWRHRCYRGIPGHFGHGTRARLGLEEPPETESASPRPAGAPRRALGVSTARAPGAPPRARCWQPPAPPPAPAPLTHAARAPPRPGPPRARAVTSGAGARARETPPTAAAARRHAGPLKGARDWKGRGPAALGHAPSFRGVTCGHRPLGAQSREPGGGRGAGGNRGGAEGGGQGENGEGLRAPCPPELEEESGARRGLPPGPSFVSFFFLFFFVATRRAAAGSFGSCWRPAFHCGVRRPGCTPALIAAAGLQSPKFLQTVFLFPAFPTPQGHYSRCYRVGRMRLGSCQQSGAAAGAAAGAEGSGAGAAKPALEPHIARPRGCSPPCPSNLIRSTRGLAKPSRGRVWIHAGIYTAERGHGRHPGSWADRRA